MEHERIEQFLLSRTSMAVLMMEPGLPSGRCYGADITECERLQRSKRGVHDIKVRWNYYSCNKIIWSVAVEVWKEPNIK